TEIYTLSLHDALPISLLGVGWLCYWTNAKSIAAQEWVTHTYQVIAALEQGRAILTDAETAQRGYLLTGDENFLKDSLTAQSQVNGWLANLRQLTADNLEQQKRLNDLQQIIAQRLAVLNNRIKLRQQNGLQVAANAVATRNGTNLSQQIQNSIAEMRAAENQLLQQRTATMRADARLA